MMMTDSTLDELGFVGETIKYATIVIATVPILCIYPLLQRYFVKGVMIGAMKG
jgi:putative aldouronate transport system permease protein